MHKCFEMTIESSADRNIEDEVSYYVNYRSDYDNLPKRSFSSVSLTTLFNALHIPTFTTTFYHQISN